MATTSEVKMTNPANSLPEKGRRKRIPLSTPRRRLETPDIEGYHTHWFLEQNIPAALQAWYEFVDQKETELNEMRVGADASASGSSDLGSQVSLTYGMDPKGEPQRLILMKIKLDYYLEDQREVAGRNAGMLESIFRGEKILTESGEKGEDQTSRYVDKDKTVLRSRALFQRPVRK